jgi:hypothetical protein
MSQTNCKNCNILFTTENRTKTRAVCKKCAYQEQKQKAEEKTKNITEKQCNTCHIIRPLSNFKSKSHNKCKLCPTNSKPIDYTNLKCNSCSIQLTEENKTSGKNKCNKCINIYNKSKSDKIINSGIHEKECKTCNKTKNISRFRTAVHKECMDCDIVKHTKISENEYRENHHEKEKKCLLCDEIKPLERFAFHTTTFRNQCKDCINKFRYYVIHRLKKLEQIGIYSDNTYHYTIHEQWMKDNPEHLKKYSRIFNNSPEGKYCQYYSMYTSRNKIEDFTGGKDKFKEFVNYFIRQNCYYCNRIFEKEGSLNNMIAGEYNGINRIDSNKNFSYDNCVSCCTFCNLMKNSSDIASFIRKCCEIAIYNNLVKLDKNDYRIKLHNEIKLVGYSGNYNKYVYAAKVKNRIFELSQELFNDITQLACYICGKTGDNGIGIDRFNNNIGYTVENSKQCCNYCNIMKRTHDYILFLQKIKEIVINTSNKQCLKKLCMNSKVNYIATSKYLPYTNDEETSDSDIFE